MKTTELHIVLKKFKPSSCAGAMYNQQWSLFLTGVVRLSDYLVIENSKWTGTAEVDTASSQYNWVVYQLWVMFYCPKIISHFFIYNSSRCIFFQLCKDLYLAYRERLNMSDSIKNYVLLSHQFFLCCILQLVRLQ